MLLFMVGDGRITHDFAVPELDGFEVLRRIRVDSDVPVVMLTARSEEIDRVVGLTVGADDHVSKPFSPLLRAYPPTIPDNRRS